MGIFLYIMVVRCHEITLQASATYTEFFIGVQSTNLCFGQRWGVYLHNSLKLVTLILCQTFSECTLILCSKPLFIMLPYMSQVKAILRMLSSYYSNSKAKDGQRYGNPFNSASVLNFVFQVGPMETTPKARKKGQPREMNLTAQCLICNGPAAAHQVSLIQRVVCILVECWCQRWFWFFLKVLSWSPHKAHIHLHSCSIMGQCAVTPAGLSSEGASPGAMSASGVMTYVRWVLEYCHS